MPLIASYEDDSGVAEVLESCVREAGWDWRLVPDNDQMLPFLRELKPDLITTGNRQIVMSGPGFVEALKSDPALCSVPVVFVTAMWDQDHLREQLRRRGLDPDRHVAGYVTKPFEGSELAGAIRRGLAPSGV